MHVIEQSEHGREASAARADSLDPRIGFPQALSRNASKMHRTSEERQKAQLEQPRGARRQEEQLPTWRNTRPRGNPETDHAELSRNQARMEAILGR